MVSADQQICKHFLLEVFGASQIVLELPNDCASQERLHENIVIEEVVDVGHSEGLHIVGHLEGIVMIGSVLGLDGYLDLVQFPLVGSEDHVVQIGEPSGSEHVRVDDLHDQVLLVLRHFGLLDLAWRLQRSVVLECVLDQYFISREHVLVELESGS